MALKRISQLPALSGVVAGDTATLNCPVGPRYQVIWLKVSDGNNANASVIIDEIRLKLNGKVQRTMTVTELDGINSRYNDPAYYLNSAMTTRSIVTPTVGCYSLFKTAGNVTYLGIFLAEPWRPQSVQEELSWPTGNISTFQIEVDVASAASSPVIQAFAEVDNAVVTTNGLQAAMPMGQIMKWDRNLVDINGTSVQWSTLKLPKGDVLMALHFVDSYITNVAMKADNYEWRDLSLTDNNMVLNSRRMTPRTTAFDLMLDYDDIPGGAGLKLDGIKDLRFNITLSDGTPRNMPVIVESFGAPN